MGATCGSKAGVADGGVSEDHGKKWISGSADQRWLALPRRHGGAVAREELAIKGVKPNKLIPSQ
jgi:hypothetical protein